MSDVVKEDLMMVGELYADGSLLSNSLLQALHRSMFVPQISQSS
jgi:hypothetical protein